MRQVWAAGSLVLGLLVTEAFAETNAKPADCPFAPALLEAADFLFNEPKTKPPIWRDRFGDDAAYFTIRYGDMSYEDGIALLRQLQARTQPPARLDELLYAYSTPSDRAKLPATSFQSAGVSGWRAMLLTEGADALFVEMNKSNPPYPSDSLSLALADLDDAAKRDYARQAEDAGFGSLAIGFLSTADDLHPLIELLDRQSLPKSQRERIIVSALYDNLFEPSFDISTQPEEVRAAHAQRTHIVAVRQILQLVSMAPQADMLMSILNYTGDERIGWIVAPSLLMDIDQGRLDPAQEPDKFFAAMVERLGLVSDWPELAIELADASASGPGGQSEKIVVLANEAMARESLGPFVRDGRVSTLPNRPRLMGRDFPWDKWVAVALDLQVGRSTAAEDSIIAANLLVATDRYQEAIAVLERDSSTVAMRKAHSIMRTLDRRCNSLLDHPIPLSDPFYRFDN